MEITLPQQVNIKTVLGIRKYFYLPAIVVALVILLLMGVVIPNIRKIMGTRKEIKQQSEKLLSLEKKATELQTMNEQDLVEELILLEEALPSGKDVLALFRSLDGLAADSQVYLGKISLSPGRIASASATPSAVPREGDLVSEQKERRGSSSLDALNFSFRLTGTFAGMMKFLENIEKLRPLMKVDTFELTSAIGGEVPVSTDSSVTSSATVDLRLSISMFYAGFPASLGQISDPIIPLTQAELELLDELANYKRYEAVGFTGIVGEGIEVEKGREDMFAPF